MKNKLSCNKLIYFILALLLLVSVIVSGRSISPVYASSAGYTGALEDLQKDSSFNVNAYPDKPDDYSIQIIQIAESKGGELFVYTYQPCQNTRNIYATEINMSLTESPNGTMLYGLVPVSTNGVFGKYKVYGFTVKSDNVRYYNITSIYRNFIQGIDKGTGNDNSKNAVSFAVGKCFKAETKDGTVIYSYNATDVVLIKNPYVDFLSYGDSQGWDLVFGVTNWTDIHYVAFSPDRRIDTLKEADVTYTTQSYHYTGKNEQGYTYGDKSDPQYLTLTGKEEYGVTGRKQYTWKSIYRSADFIEKGGLNETAKKEVGKTEFVLVFLTTSFEEKTEYSFMQGHYKVADGTKVSDVSILRLEFETDKVLYNLGAVMDKQEGDEFAGNKPDYTSLLDKLCEWLESVTGVPALAWKIIICALPFIVLLPILGAIFPAFGQILLIALKYILWVICLPFKFTKWLFNKLKGGE